MILTAHQPVYLPWLGLFHKIALADKFNFFDNCQYVPKDWISRNQVKTANGPVMLTVPVLTKGHREKVIADMEINNDLPWARKHWQTIRNGYKKARYFDRYAGFFEDLYRREWRLLADLNYHMLSWFLKDARHRCGGVKGERMQFSRVKIRSCPRHVSEAQSGYVYIRHPGQGLCRYGEV